MPERQSVETPQPEHKEHEPKINYHFLYSPHRTAEDFSKLEEAFKKADIYVPEAAGWTPEDKKSFQGISEGMVRPEEIGWDPSSARFFELKLLYKSKKPVLIADIPSSDENELLTDKTTPIGARSFEAFRTGRFSESLVLMRKYIKMLAESQLGREKEIKKNLDAEIENLLKSEPEHSNKKELTVLIALGAAHTPIYQKLNRENRNVSREFNPSQFIYSWIVEAMRRVEFDKKLDDEVLARAILSWDVDGLLYEITNSTEKVFRVSRKIIGKLSLKDIKNISEKAGKNGGEIDIVQELEARGIKVPRTEEEMDRLVGPYKK